jgi:prephenate dehydrogenase
MEEPGFTGGLETLRVAVWGLGLMGGSLAMALRGRCAAVLGIDPDPAVVAMAQERAAADCVSTDPAELLPEADVIVAAAPVRGIIAQMAALSDNPALSPRGAVVMDLGSTKTEILRAMDGLPERFDPLGGHPMCGREKSSLAHADAQLYQNAPFALAALPRTTGRARAIGEALARVVGASPLWVEAGEHDAWVAATSHVPYLLACALAQSTPEAAAALIGPGWRGEARLAGSEPRMMADIAATNGENIRAALRLVMARLEEYDFLLTTGNADLLADQFRHVAETYERILKQAR